MSVKSVLDRTRRIRVPVLPIEAVFAYVLMGAERLLFVFLVIVWGEDFHPMKYHGALEFWWDDYNFSRSLPEAFVFINLFVVVFLWCSWRGWRAAHPLRARSARGAALAFLAPAIMLALFSWLLVQSAFIPTQQYSVQRIEHSVLHEP